MTKLLLVLLGASLLLLGAAGGARVNTWAQSALKSSPFFYRLPQPRIERGMPTWGTQVNDGRGPSRA